MKISKLSVVAAAAMIALSGCAANESATPSSGAAQSSAGDAQSGTGGAAPSDGISGTFTGAGATSQEAAQASWTAEFQMANPNVTINYNPVGSGAGRKQFIEGAAVFAGSDSALSDEELGGSFASCAAGTKAIDLPVYVSPIAVAFNVDGVTDLKMDSATIAKIFKGDITNWNDPAIASLNPDAKLPDQNITVVYRSDDSGTSKNFGDYLNQTAGDVWTEAPADKYPYSFAGAEGAQGTSGVISAITNGTGTIGYADASKVGSLSTVSLKVGDAFVAPSAEGAAKVVDASPAAEGREANDIAIKLDRNTTEAGAYPLVLVSYLIVCNEYADSKNADFVRDYAGYIVSAEGQDAAAKGAGSAPISDQTRAAITKVLSQIK